MKNTILITLTPSDDFITLQTCDAAHGKSQRFYLRKEALSDALANRSSVIDADLNSFCRIGCYQQASIHFLVYWLRVRWNNACEGYRQQFDLPTVKLQAVLEGKPVRCTVDPDAPKGQARLVLSEQAHRKIAELRKDKLTRHALRRFFRDNFRYGSQETLLIEPDPWVNGFFFRSQNDGFSGGIVPHITEVNGSDGRKHIKRFFAVHT